MIQEKRNITPGVWKLDETGTIVVVTGNEYCGGVHVVHNGFNKDAVSEENAKADARLISAAPELLEALIAMHERYDCCVECEKDDILMHKSEKAIKKALG